MLRRFGAEIGKGVQVYPSVKITIPWNVSMGDYATAGDCVTLYALGPINIGRRSTISQNAHLCAGTHDFRGTAMTLIKAPISILDDSWICADAFVGPGVTIGRGAIVGARAVVMKDVEKNSIMAGNPAVQIGYRDAASKK